VAESVLLAAEPLARGFATFFFLAALPPSAPRFAEAAFWDLAPLAAAAGRWKE